MVRHRVAEAGVQSGSTAWTVALAEASEEARPMVRKMREARGAGDTRRITADHRATREETEAPLLVMVEGEDAHSS